MIEWFINLSNSEKIAIAVPVSIAILGGIFKLVRKKGKTSEQKTENHQKGSGNTAIANKGDGSTIAGRDVNIGIDPDTFLDRYDKKTEELVKAKEKNRQLEEQLAQPRLLVGSGELRSPQPTQEAKVLADQIDDDAGPYALALKAIADGNAEKADKLLDQTQKLVDHIQKRKDEAQAKIYMARIQNALYAGRHQDALQYCNILQKLAKDDTLILNQIAMVYYINAKYNEAEPLMERALKIDEKSFGSGHPKVAIDLNNLAELYRATNRLKEAEPMMERAFKIDERSFGSDHPKVAIRLNNLAGLYQNTNRIKEAEPLMERALAIDEKSFGSDHPIVAIDLNNLAVLYQDTNRLNKAETLMERALKIDEKSFGSDHPIVAIDLNNLAQLYQNTNRFKKAEPLMERVVEIFEKSLGKDHPNVATALNNLAGLYQATNRMAKAEPLMERVVEIWEKSLGKDHPNVAAALNNLAVLYKATKRLKEAEPLMERQLVIFIEFTQSTGHRHPNLEVATKNYIGLLMEMGYSREEIDERLNRLGI